MSVKTKASIRKQRARQGLCVDCGQLRSTMTVTNRRNQVVYRVHPNDTQCGTCRWERPQR
jgi:hypothetical protein